MHSDIIICDSLGDLVPFTQIKEREKHPWRSVTFSKVADVSYIWLVRTLYVVFHAVIDSNVCGNNML